jgi:hypothetical protein
MKPWKCSRCGKKYANPDSVRIHVRDKHKGKGEPCRVPSPEDDESFADRAIQAEIDRAMGIPNDDDWLLP